MGGSRESQKRRRRSHSAGRNVAGKVAGGGEQPLGIGRTPAFRLPGNDDANGLPLYAPSPPDGLYDPLVRFGKKHYGGYCQGSFRPFEFFEAYGRYVFSLLVLIGGVEFARSGELNRQIVSFEGGIDLPDLSQQKYALDILLAYTILLVPTFLFWHYLVRPIAKKIIKNRK